MAGKGSRQRAHATRYRTLMAAVEADHDGPGAGDWTGIAQGYDDWQQRITIRVDISVLRWFRSDGPGYQVRMNRVLAAYVQGHLGAVTAGPEAARTAEGLPEGRLTLMLALAREAGRREALEGMVRGNAAGAEIQL